MDYSIKINEFEGPLDLLLHLIKQSNIDIYDIEISEITKQYLDYINKMDANSVEVVNWNRSAIGFKTGNEATDAAVADFIAYLIEQNGRWVQILNAYSPYYAVQENADYQAFVSNDMALKALGEQLVNGLVPPTFSGSAQVRTELDTMMKGVLNEGWTAEQAVNTAATNSEAAMNE